MGLQHEIDCAEFSIKNIRVKLQGIGREIYRLREGEELSPSYGFDGYSRENFQGIHYSGQDGPDWGVGTPIISLRYYWPRAENVIYVTIPQGWLDADYVALEAARLSDEVAAENAAEQRRLEEAAKAKEASERRTYERLKRKFETAPQPKEPTHDPD